MGWLRWGRTEKERKERDILIEGAIMRLARNPTLGKLSVIHMNDRR